MDTVLDPAFACSEDTKKLSRNKYGGVRSALDHINSLWDVCLVPFRSQYMDLGRNCSWPFQSYDTAFYKNCEDEQPSRIYLQQSYIPFKEKIQKANDAYQNIDAYCATQS